MEPTPESNDRRRLFKLAIGASAAIISAITVIPGIGYLLSPALSGGRRTKRKVVFQNPQDATSQTFVAARFEGQEETAPGIFVRTVNGKPEALSAKCTHTGCAVNWQAEQNGFVCPCHGGKFDSSGKNIAGPPPRPLDNLNAAISSGALYIEEPEV